MLSPCIQFLDSLAASLCLNRLSILNLLTIPTFFWASIPTLIVWTRVWGIGNWYTMFSCPFCETIEGKQPVPGSLHRLKLHEDPGLRGLARHGLGERGPLRWSLRGEGVLLPRLAIAMACHEAWCFTVVQQLNIGVTMRINNCWKKLKEREIVDHSG